MTHKKLCFYISFYLLLLLLLLLAIWLVPKPILETINLSWKLILIFVIPGFYWAGKGYKRKVFLTVFFGLLVGGALPLAMANADNSLNSFALFFVPVAVFFFHRGWRSDKPEKYIEKNTHDPPPRRLQKQRWSVKGDRDSFWRTGGLADVAGLVGLALSAVLAFPLIGIIFGAILAAIWPSDANTNWSFRMMITALSGGMAGFVFGFIFLYYFLKKRQRVTDFLKGAASPGGFSSGCRLGGFGGGRSGGAGSVGRW